MKTALLFTALSLLSTATSYGYGALGSSLEHQKGMYFYYVGGRLQSATYANANARSALMSAADKRVVPADQEDPDYYDHGCSYTAETQRMLAVVRANLKEKEGRWFPKRNAALRVIDQASAFGKKIEAQCAAATTREQALQVKEALEKQDEIMQKALELLDLNVR